MKKCLVCNKEFTKEQLVYKARKYCNHKCYARMKKMRGDRVLWTKEMRIKFSKRQQGSNNPAWKGGITKDRTKSLNTIQYKRFKELAFKMQGRYCNFCKSEKSLQLDHITPWRIEPKLRWSLGNVQILCAPCHYKKSSDESKKYWINQYGKSKYYTSRR